MLLALTASSPALAEHSVAGSGGCASHTRACYPNCWFEWTGNQGNVADGPPDVGPCEYPVATQAIGTQTFAFDGNSILNAKIVNGEGEPVPVATSTIWPVSWGSAYPVTVTNDATERVPVQAETTMTLSGAEENPARIVNEGFDSKTLTVVFALGGLVAAFIVGPVVFRALIRNRGL